MNLYVSLDIFQQYIRYVENHSDGIVIKWWYKASMLAALSINEGTQNHVQKVGKNTCKIVSAQMSKWLQMRSTSLWPNEGKNESHQILKYILELN